MRRATVLMLLCALLNGGCAKEAPQIDALLAQIEKSGVRLGPPTGLMAGSVADVENAANLTAGGSKPLVRFLESERQVIVTVYRFDNESAAKALGAFLEKQDERSMLPERARAVVGRQEIVIKGNFVVALRYREEAAAEKERIREAILAF